MKRDHNKRCLRTSHLCTEFYEFLSSDPEISSLLCKFLKNRKPLIIKGYLYIFSPITKHNITAVNYIQVLSCVHFSTPPLPTFSIQLITFQGVHIKLRACGIILSTKNMASILSN